MTLPDPLPAEPDPATSPPRAFTQGVGTVFQFVGVGTFLAFFFVCCFSSLLSRDTATHSTLSSVGWGSYTAQRALSISIVVGVFLGMALAGIGLGLQAQRRGSPMMGVLVCAFGALFWLTHTIFFGLGAGAYLLALFSFILTILFGGLLILSINSWKEMKQTPPPAGHELLPADYKIPYSHLHQDPPEVRLVKELEQRRQRLAVEQKELELLEQKLHRQRKDPPA